MHIACATMRRMPLANAKEWVLDLVFPKYCLSCEKEGNFLCFSCREAYLIFDAPHCPVCAKRNFTGILCAGCQEKIGLRRFFAPFSYRAKLVRDLIHEYKYEGIRSLGAIFAEEIARFLAFYGARIPANAVFIPIPLARSRERARGFNQALLLADELGRRLHIPVSSPLRRTRATAQQIEMESHEARRTNVAGAFAMKDQNAVSGKTAILVDDVSTSGATLSEAAAVLRAHGAKTVWAIVIAKG